MGIQDYMGDEKSYITDTVVSKLRKLKKYTIRNKDGSCLIKPDDIYAVHMATAAYKEDGYKLFEWYKEYAVFFEMVKKFRIAFRKEFAEIYYSTAFSNNKFKKIGDLPAAQELFEMWGPLDDTDSYSNNKEWMRKWLKEMAYDDSAFIGPLNMAQLRNNKRAYKEAKAARLTLCKNNEKDLNDYVIYKELIKVKDADGKTVKTVSDMKLTTGEEDDIDE